MNIPNRKRAAIDWSKYYVLRCGSCKSYHGGIAGNCSVQCGADKMYDDKCEKHEPQAQYSEKIAVLDVGTRRYPKYIRADTMEDVPTGCDDAMCERCKKCMAGPEQRSL